MQLSSCYSPLDTLTTIPYPKLYIGSAAADDFHFKTFCSLFQFFHFADWGAKWTSGKGLWRPTERRAKVGGIPWTFTCMRNLFSTFHLHISIFLAFGRQFVNSGVKISHWTLQTTNVMSQHLEPPQLCSFLFLLRAHCLPILCKLYR